MLKNGSKLSEKILCDIWKNKVIQKELKTFNDESITVINTGSVNNETAGPDFLNAKIRIGNLVYVGDVEIDVDYTDWKSHGHYLDKRYNKVILHASLINRNQSSHVYSKEGRKISVSTTPGRGTGKGWGNVRPTDVARSTVLLWMTND